MELCSLLAIYLGPNCGGGNEDTGDLQKIPGMQCYTQCPQPCSRPPRPTPLLETPGHSQASLGQSLLGPCSFLLGPGAQGPVCALQESTSQSCASFGSSMVGLMVTSSKRAYAMPRSTAPRAPAPWQSTADPYLHRRHSEFCRSICGVSGSWCTQGLFEPS